MRCRFGGGFLEEVSDNHVVIVSEMDTKCAEIDTSSMNEVGCVGMITI